MIFSVIVIYHSQGSASIESKMSERKPLLTELEDTPIITPQVNSAAYIVFGLRMSFLPNDLNKMLL